jgi:hypothetical protein
VRGLSLRGLKDAHRTKHFFIATTFRSWRTYPCKRLLAKKIVRLKPLRLGQKSHDLKVVAMKLMRPTFYNFSGEKKTVLIIFTD